MQKLSEILSETNRKTERKARLMSYAARTAKYSPIPEQSSCAWCPFVFLLAVLSHNQIIFQIK